MNEFQRMHFDVAKMRILFEVNDETLFLYFLRESESGRVAERFQKEKYSSVRRKISILFFFSSSKIVNCRQQKTTTTFISHIY